MPIADGVVALPEQTLSYDKPEGRITRVTGALETVDATGVKAYYASALPALGWTQNATDRYSRGGENLRLWIEAYEDTHYLHIQIEP